MDLETIIPLVIIAAAYLFKAFENAAKKNAKKEPPVPKRPAAPAKRVTSRRVEQPTASPAPAPQAGIPEGNWWDENSTIPGRETRPARERYPEKEIAPRDYQNRPHRPAASGAAQVDKPLVIKEKEYAERVQTSRDARQRRKPVEVVQLEDEAREAGAAHEYAEFDLQDAVIKSVILERREF